MPNARSRTALACAAAALIACAAPIPLHPKPAQPSPEPPTDPFPLELSLPVDGIWIVSQGYHGAETHHGRAAYALDLVKLDDAGRAYARSGRRAEDWFGFGAEVLASADGVVVRAIDRHADNGDSRDANSVIVQHGDVFSEYVHLEQSSLRVREGERVRRGQVLARCGSSGAETPHLHWALLSSIEPIRTRPAQLAPYERRDASGAWHTAREAPGINDVIRALAASSPSSVD